MNDPQAYRQSGGAFREDTVSPPGASRVVKPPSDTRRRRIFFANRYFFPDHSATSQILSDLAFHLAGRGHDVHVLTSRQRYDDPSAQLPEMEVVKGVAIHRLATTRFGRAALIGRGVDYASFYASTWRSIRALARPGDILVAKTDPPLLCLPALHVARRRKLHLINWLQDLYPEVAMRLGVPLVGGPLGRGLMRWRDAALTAAEANIVVGAGMAETVRSRGIAPDQIQVIANWCDDETTQPLAHAENPLRRAWGLEDRFVVGYSGNLGRAHEFDTVLAAAERLRDNPAIVFLCIGGGKKFDELAHSVGERDLERSFRFLPYQDRAELRYSLGVPDIHWLSLKPELEGLIVPSKLYGIAASGRPLIALTAADGEVARLVRQHECGIVITPGDGDGLARALLHLSTNRPALEAMGERARAMLDRHFTRRQAFERWETLIASAGRAPSWASSQRHEAVEASA